MCSCIMNIATGWHQYMLSTFTHLSMYQVSLQSPLKFCPDVAISKCSPHTAETCFWHLTDICHKSSVSRFCAAIFYNYIMSCMQRYLFVCLCILLH